MRNFFTNLLFLFLLLFYPLTAIVTFGWSASDPKCRVSGDPCDGGQRFLIGGAAAIFWPLYWSWEIADRIRAPQKAEMVKKSASLFDGLCDACDGADKSQCNCTP